MPSSQILLRHHRQVDYYLDAVLGDDANSGTRIISPKKTIASALAANPYARLWLAKKPGGAFYDANSAVRQDLTVLAYGAGEAIIGAEQSAKGLLWQLVPGMVNTWFLVMNYREATINNGVDSSTSNHAVFEGNTLLAWKVGGADQQANVNAVEATPGSFTVHRTGSSLQDPRFDLNATQYTIYVHLSDSSNPNGKDVRVTDRAIVMQTIGGRVKGVVIEHAFWKDFFKSSSTGKIPVWEDITIRNHNEHGSVGPVQLKGTVTTIGRATPGNTLSDTFGRAWGGGINIYTSSGRSEKLHWPCHLIQSNTHKGLYGHTSQTDGVPGYPSLYLQQHTVTNASVAVVFDPTSTGFAPFIPLGEIGKFDYSGVDCAFDLQGHWTFGEERVTGRNTVTLSTASYNPSNQVFFLNSRGNNDVFHVHNTNIINPMLNMGTVRSLLRRIPTDSTAYPEAHFHNCSDLSANDRKLHIYRSAGSPAMSKWKVYLYGTCIFGDLQDQDHGTNWPVLFNIETGGTYTFGFGRRTPSEIIAAMTAAGVAHNLTLGAFTAVNHLNQQMVDPVAPNMVRDGGFSLGHLGNWVDASTNGSTVTVVGGKCRFTRGTNERAILRQPLLIPTVIGQSYTLSYTLSNIVNGLQLRGQAGISNGDMSLLNVIDATEGLKSHTFTATTATTWIGFASNGTIAGSSVDLDDVDCRVTGT